MSKSLEWYKDASDDAPESQAYGHGDIRLYRLGVQAHGRWTVTLSYEGAGGALARGWALSPDEAKQIAQEWEDGFGRYEYPPPRLGDDELNVKGEPKTSRSAASAERAPVIVDGETYMVRPATADRIRRLAAVDLSWAGGASHWVAGSGEDTYRIWRLGRNEKWADSYELWWWDGPYTGIGMMGGDLRGAENAHKLGTYPSARTAKAAAARHARSKTGPTLFSN